MLYWMAMFGGSAPLPLEQGKLASLPGSDNGFVPGKLLIAAQIREGSDTAV